MNTDEIYAHALGVRLDGEIPEPPRAVDPDDDLAERQRRQCQATTANRLADLLQLPGTAGLAEIPEPPVDPSATLSSPRAVDPDGDFVPYVTAVKWWEQWQASETRAATAECALRRELEKTATLQILLALVAALLMIVIMCAARNG